MHERNALIISLILVVLTSACATTTTRQAFIEPEIIEAEKMKQRQLAIEYQAQQQRRLDDIAFPILVAATPLCPDDVTIMFGLRVSTRYQYPDDWRSAAETVLGVGDSLRVTAVTRGSSAERAGMRPSDVLVELDDRSLPSGEEALEEFSETMSGLVAEDRLQVPIGWTREGKIHRDLLVGDRACGYSTQVVDGGGLNAEADGENIYVFSPLMRFTKDHELAVVVAHELAHNAMKHRKAKAKNRLIGALFGALGDVAMAAAGYNTGGYYTVEGANLGSFAYSQDFEREADYVGLYALALAGYEISEAPTFWRHMAMANPQSIGLAFTHPTSAERFVRLERTLKEIENKIRNRIPLQPEMKSE